MMMRNRFLKQNGFTLVELLVAITIFAIGLLGVAGMQVTALRENSSSHTRTATTALASGIMEEIRQWNAEDPRLAVSSTNNEWSFDGEPTIYIDGAGTLRATYDVTVDFNDVTNINRIRVVVSGPGMPVTLVGFRRGS
jgi:type IV pilus assembly protein PilV